MSIARAGYDNRHGTAGCIEASGLLVIQCIRSESSRDPLLEPARESCQGARDKVVAAIRVRARGSPGRYGMAIID